MSNRIHSFKKDLEINMQKCINNFKININKIYIGRISANILDSIMIEYYGNLTPISQFTNSIVERPQTLAITVFDPKMLKIIEKSILSSNLGVTSVIDQNIIRITLPSLTEDRRYTLIKMVRSEAEKSKISIRSIRRISNDKIKILLKSKSISKDDERYFQNTIQSITDIWIKKIDSILEKKESELMTF